MDGEDMFLQKVTDTMDGEDMFLQKVTDNNTGRSSTTVYHKTWRALYKCTSTHIAKLTVQYKMTNQEQIIFYDHNNDGGQFNGKQFDM